MGICEIDVCCLQGQQLFKAEKLAKNVEKIELSQNCLANTSGQSGQLGQSQPKKNQAKAKRGDVYCQRGYRGFISETNDTSDTLATEVNTIPATKEDKE